MKRIILILFVLINFKVMADERKQKPPLENCADVQFMYVWGEADDVKKFIAQPIDVKMKDLKFMENFPYFRFVKICERERLGREEEFDEEWTGI
jgi:hypothetical protein